MEKETIRSYHNRSGGGESTTKQTASDFGFQWGNRKRLRCMKVQANDQLNHNNNPGPAHRTTARVDRRVVRADHNKDPNNNNNQPSTTNIININNIINNQGYGYFNLRQRPSSPSPLQGSQRVLRNSENSSAMRGQINGGMRRLASPNNNNNNNNNNNHHHENNYNNNINNKSGASSETAQDSKKGGGSSSGSGEAAAAAAPPVWPPKFVIALTNKEKEEDFFVFKGSKLPQRPKKRAKLIQRTLNLVSPGAWLCDLTLERYEVREKKVSKKRPRGLKAMGNMDSDSE